MGSCSCKIRHAIILETLEQRAKILDFQQPAVDLDLKRFPEGDTPRVLAREDTGDVYILSKPPGWLVDVERSDFDDFDDFDELTTVGGASNQSMADSHMVC